MNKALNEAVQHLPPALQQAMHAILNELNAGESKEAKKKRLCRATNDERHLTKRLQVKEQEAQALRDQLKKVEEEIPVIRTHRDDVTKEREVLAIEIQRMEDDPIPTKGEPNSDEEREREMEDPRGPGPDPTQLDATQLDALIHSLQEKRNQLDGSLGDRISKRQRALSRDSGGTVDADMYSTWAADS